MAQLTERVSALGESAYFKEENIALLEGALQEQVRPRARKALRAAPATSRRRGARVLTRLAPLPAAAPPHAPAEGVRQQVRGAA